MKVEYDAKSDLLYFNMAPDDVRAARTETPAPGIHVDYDRDGKVIGVEFLEASSFLGSNLRVEFELRPTG